MPVPWEAKSAINFILIALAFNQKKKNKNQESSYVVYQSKPLYVVYQKTLKQKEKERECEYL